MDPNNQNQNLDGIKPADGPAPTSGVDGFVVPPRQMPPSQEGTYGTSETQPEEQNNIEQPAPHYPIPANKQKSGRLAKVFLVIFIVLFAASAAAAGMLYMQNKQSQDDLKTQQQKTTQLQKQVDDLNQSSSKDQVEKLTTENANLQKTVNAQKAYITTLTKAAQDLKTKCGTSCSAIVIPPNTITTTTTTTTTTP